MVFESSLKQAYGDHGGGETPGSIPNPAVKPSSADGTAGGTRGRVGRCHVPALLLFATFMPLKEML